MSITSTILEPELWIERYGDDLYRFALSRVADVAWAEELVQATLLSALTGMQAFRGEASERTWLFLILRRKLIDHYRRQARHPEVSLTEVTPDGPAETVFFHPEDGHWREAHYPASWQSADGPLEQAELQLTLQGCQDKLPPQHAAVFVLRFVEELTAEEICKELGLTTSNYWVIVHRAKLQLRRCLEKQGLGRRPDFIFFCLPYHGLLPCIMLRFISCQQATLLVEQQADVALPPVDRQHLARHLHYCPYCASYAQQSTLLSGLAKAAAQRRVSQEAGLPLAVKARLQQRVREQYLRLQKEK